MTPDEFDAVDIDLLADYAGGALDGDDEERVARLVADDPAWGDAYALLVPGMDAVAADLRGLEPEPMPDDVVARLDAALAARPHLTVVPATDTGAADDADPVPAADVDGGPPAGPSRSIVRRRLRWAAPIAAAAGVLAFAGIGADYLMNGSERLADTSGGASNADRGSPMIAAEAAGLVTGLTDDLIRASGEDYDRATLAAPLAAAGTMGAPDAADDLRKGESLAPPQSSRTGIAPDPGFPALQRLRARDALRACLEAIATGQGSGPITVHSVDYARYRGQPALIVQFAAGGVSWAWASGPECGTQGAGADLVDRVRVG